MEHMGFISLIPPLLAIILAVIYRNVILALFAGVYFGVTALAGFNPIQGLFITIKDYLFPTVASGYNASVLVMMAIIGGFVHVVSESGGAVDFAQKVSRWVNSRFKAQLAVWFGGLFIFFSDSANPLLLGPVFQPVTDKLRVSREKLAWLIDSTASPVCVMIPFIGWGIYNMNLIKQQFEALNIVESEWTAFINAIPFQFYSIAVVLMVPLVAFLAFEFGPMAKAEHRTRFTGQPLDPNAEPLRPPTSINLKEGVTPQAITIWLPILILFGVFFSLIIPHGFPRTPVPGPILRTSLTMGYLLASATCIILMVNYKIMSFKDSFNTFIKGMKDMMYILVILVLAWALGSVAKNMGTANYVIQVVGDYIPGWIIPALIFVTGAVIAFTTGTSWGTFAILMPLAIPLAIKLDAPLYASIAAVLSGGLFGDHCSPISDTTIMSSMGAASDHVDHVKTQFPYALTAAAAAFIGYLAAGLTGNVVIGLGLTLILLVVFVIALSKVAGERIPEYTMEDIQKETIQG